MTKPNQPTKCLTTTSDSYTSIPSSNFAWKTSLTFHVNLENKIDVVFYTHNTWGTIDKIHPMDKQTFKVSRSHNSADFKSWNQVPEYISVTSTFHINQLYQDSCQSVKAVNCPDFNTEQSTNKQTSQLHGGVCKPSNLSLLEYHISYSESQSIFRHRLTWLYMYHKYEHCVDKKNLNLC